MRWLSVLLLMIIWVLLPTPALAQTSDSVTVTVSGYVVEAPGDFTLTYISDYEVGITWTKPASSNNTMVRASYNGYPATRAEGYLVYYGTGTSASDNTVSLDETASPVYYRAWSENTTGEWSPEYAEGEIEGIGMKLIAFVVLAVLLSIASHAFKKMVLGFAAAGGWLLLGFYNWSLIADFGQLYWGFAFFCWGMVIVSVFDAMMGQRGKKEIGDDYEIDDAILEEEKEVDAMIAEQETQLRPSKKLRDYFDKNKKNKKKRKASMRKIARKEARRAVEQGD